MKFTNLKALFLVFVIYGAGSVYADSDNAQPNGEIKIVCKDDQGKTDISCSNNPIKGSYIETCCRCKYQSVGGDNYKLSATCMKENKKLAYPEIENNRNTCGKLFNKDGTLVCE